MTIKYECNVCHQVLAEGPEVYEDSSVLIKGVLFLTKHVTETGHRDMGYKSDGSKLDIRVSERGQVSIHKIS